MEDTIKRGKKIIEIYPTKVGRRILVFLSDIFMNLILSIILFEICVFSISRLVIDYDGLLSRSDNYQREQYGLLYEHNLLYFDEAKHGIENRFKLSLALEDTNYYFVEFYSDPSNEELSKYDIFYNYFVLTKGQENKEKALADLNSLYLQYGENFFDQNSKTCLGTFSLKKSFADEFKPNYISGDEMSSQAKTDYDNFTKSVFLNIYNQMFSDIKANDLSSLDGLRSYKEIESKISSINDTLNLDYVVCSYISFVFSCIILFLVVPLITEKRQTLSEKILKIERVNKTKIAYINRPLVLNIFLLKMFDGLTLLFLVPVAHVGFNYIFALPILYLPSLIAIVLALINLCITAFTKLNTSLKEITTDSIMCNQSSIDEYYRELEEF